MSEKRLAIAFFIPGSDRDLPTLTQLAGVEDLYESDAHYGRWDGMEGTRVTLETVDIHACLVLWPWLSSFFDALGPRAPGVELGLAEDPVLPRAQAFLAAADRLGAEAGIVATHLDQATPGWIRAQYHYVLGMDARALVNQRYGLLYLDQRLAEDTGDLDDRDTIDAERGLLVFGGRGATRWF